MVFGGPQGHVDRLSARLSACIAAFPLEYTECKRRQPNLVPLPNREFMARYDTTTQIVTGVVFAILIFVSIVTKSLIVSALGAALLVLAYAWSPRRYAISGRMILVKRLFGNVSIPLDSVRAVRPATNDDFRSCIRVWGSGGLFGYYGTFSTTSLGDSTWYVTDRGKAAIVFTNERTIVLSPDDAPAFVAAIRETAPVSAISGQEFAGTVRSSAARSLGVWIGVAIGVAAVTFVAFALMYSPGAPQYTLTPDSLTIHDRFYPVTVNAADLDIAGIRIVDIRTDPAWQPTARTNGFSNSHYHSGWFRVANRDTARMYWADRTRLVLLPPRGIGSPVLLQVNDPEKFVAQVRETWHRQLGYSSGAGAAPAAGAPPASAGRNTHSEHTEQADEASAAGEAPAPQTPVAVDPLILSEELEHVDTHASQDLHGRRRRLAGAQVSAGDHLRVDEQAQFISQKVILRLVADGEAGAGRGA